jgi:hypothetical protein
MTIEEGILPPLLPIPWTDPTTTCPHREAHTAWPNFVPVKSEKATSLFPEYRFSENHLSHFFSSLSRLTFIEL